jgi:tight adherence protein B
VAIEVILIAGAAALGVALVVFGMVFPQRAATYQGDTQPRVTYGTLAEVREQLRRRFEPTGAPAWIASDQWQTRLQRDLVSADIPLRPYEFRILQGISVLIFALIALARFGISPAIVVLGGLGYILPYLYVRRRLGHRLRSFDAALPTAMELIANAMKAGQSVTQALSSVTDNAPPPVSDEFMLARREIELGASIESALNNMVKRINSSDLRLMVMVITIQHSVGGDLPSVLITLADTMKQRAEMREEILAATAQSRATALIITLLPIGAAVLLYFLVPDYFRPMFFNPVGWVILGLAGFLLFIGNLLIRRLTAIA